MNSVLCHHSLLGWSTSFSTSPGLQSVSSSQRQGACVCGSRCSPGGRLLPSIFPERCRSCRPSAPVYYAVASSTLDGPYGTSPGHTIQVGNGASSASIAKAAVMERMTGGAFDFVGATDPLTTKPLRLQKKIVLVRHGLSSWNEENRVQGSSDLSVLTEKGIAQAKKCRQALMNFKFDQCYASPISRAKSSAEVIWSGRKEPLVFLDTLREADLHVLQGMRNADAREKYPELFRAWREDPSNFCVDGVYPVVDLWEKSKLAWQDILSAPGELLLVVTHKSILRALLCTALGLGPDRFRAIDINNGGVSTFSVNKRGEPMLESLNMTAHLHADGVFYL